VNKAQTAVGTTVSIWRYPVKSMLGEELNSSNVSERGLVGDRTYAIIDKETGKVASAKNPRKWEKLFDCHSVLMGIPQVAENIPPVRIELPDGTQILSSNGEDADHSLSKVFGREVRLMRADLEKPSYEEYWPNIEGLAQRETVTDENMPPRTFFDISVIHILTSSTIHRLRELYPEGRFEVRRFRPNIVIDSASGEKDFIENSWIGKKLAIGQDVVVRVTGPCTRCVMITLPQGDLPRDSGILKTVAKFNQVNVGVYASVIRGGTIHRGDPVRLEA
jgi:uncharacterized protein